MESAQLFLAPAKQVVECQTLMALGKMLREGFDPSAPGEIYERKNAFVEETEARSGFSPTAECFGVFSHSKGFGADRSSSKTDSPKVPRFQVKVPK